MPETQKITFRAVFFRQHALLIVKPPEMPIFCRLNLRCDLSEPVLTAMGWTVGLGSSTEAKTGSLNGVNAVFTPASKALQDREMQLEVSTIDSFKVVPVTRDGEVIGHELQFQARTIQADAQDLVRTFLDAVGEEKSSMRLTYTLEPVQEALPGVAEGDRNTE